ncbi:molybdate ABC transporter substrate-binding protein [Iodidimonas sp. SYSU 1G8]
MSRLKWMRTKVLLLAASLAALTFSLPARAESPGITVFAAASLTNALQDLGAAYTARTGVAVRFSFASSSAVARQIEAGAPADLFVSADTEWMDYLEERGLIETASRKNLVANRLVLIAPSDRAVQLEIKRGFPIAAALGTGGRLSLGDPAFVPAGRYAEDALRTLGVWDSLAGRLLPAENVRSALAFVARGEAPLGIVYRSDVTVEPKVRIVGLFPADSHTPIVYPVALVKGGNPQAQAFLGFLTEEGAKAVFDKYGFSPLP